VTSFFGIGERRCYMIFSKMSRWICANLFSGFRRKTLTIFITTCIEKYCI